MKTEKNLLNMRFGKLTVTGRSLRDGYWECRCTCGRTVNVRTANLLSGVTTSCGCTAGRIKDLTGQRYGSLTVLEPVPDRAADRSVRWICRCDCGNTVTVSSNKLRTGHTTSCGCRKTAAANAAKTFIDGTCVEILMSDTINSNNTSGHKGVARKGTKWQAYITFRRKMYWLGTHDTYAEAVKAREAAEDQLREHIDEMLAEERGETAVIATA